MFFKNTKFGVRSKNGHSIRPVRLRRAPVQSSLEFHLLYTQFPFLLNQSPHENVSLYHISLLLSSHRSFFWSTATIWETELPYLHSWTSSLFVFFSEMSDSPNATLSEALVSSISCLFTLSPPPRLKKERSTSRSRCTYHQRESLIPCVFFSFFDGWSYGDPSWDS